MIARKSGLSDTTIRRVKLGAEAEGWASHERALLVAIEQLNDQCEIDDSCWSALQNGYDENQILDLIFTVGNYRLLAGLMKSAGIIRDSGVPGLDEP